MVDYQLRTKQSLEDFAKYLQELDQSCIGVKGYTCDNIAFDVYQIKAEYILRRFNLIEKSRKDHELDALASKIEWLYDREMERNKT